MYNRAISQEVTSVVEPKLFVFAPAPTFKKFRLRLRIKKWIFHVLMKEYQTNSHAWFYTIWISIYIYYLSWPGAPGAGAETSTFRLRPKVPAPCGSGSVSGSTTLVVTIKHCCADLCRLHWKYVLGVHTMYEESKNPSTLNFFNTKSQAHWRLEAHKRKAGVWIQMCSDSFLLSFQDSDPF
jgi:hypothetical protein